MGERRSFKAHTQKTPQSPLSRLTIGTQNGMVSETPTYAASAIEIMNSLLAEEEASVVSASPSADIVALRTCVTHRGRNFRSCSFGTACVAKRRLGSLRSS